MPKHKKGSGWKRSYYEAQKSVTIRHKKQQLAKRVAKRDMWIKKGVKKNGKKVLSLADRKAQNLNHNTGHKSKPEKA